MAFKGLDLTGKTAVVIGGTSGIGRAIALGYVDAGANVIATSRRKEQVEAVAAEIEERGGKTLRITSDVAEREVCRAIVGSCRQEVRQRGNSGELRRTHKASPDARFLRGRLEPDHGDEPDRHA